MNKKTVRRILITTKDFKAFWKKQGPFKYALTSAEFPPVLLELEEWIFSDNIICLLKELMQWDLRKIAIVAAPFNKNRRDVLKPDTIIPWKIDNFPQEWESAVCETFTPLGYLTEAVKNIDSRGSNIETVFFESLEENITKIGYVLLKPEPSIGNEDAAYITSYIDEWQADEDDG
ncbi:MAG: hypothetical protein HQK73_08060 [Desulfamplus sp.]|nr:hypothetical protein [Desulfamplus sp.]MBF0411977.1 hypothetical protein [Desulfamplus sp.]